MEDKIIKHPRPISLGYADITKYFYGEACPPVGPVQMFALAKLEHLEFDALVPLQPLKPTIKSMEIEAMIRAYYFPYKTSPADDFKKSIGNVIIPKHPKINPPGEKSPDISDPQFAFTGELNGCEIYVTEEDPDHLCIWHFPSPRSYHVDRERFEQTYKILAQLKVENYSIQGKEAAEGFGYLYYNTEKREWQIVAITLERTVKDDPVSLKEWPGGQHLKFPGTDIKPTIKIIPVNY